MKLGLDEIEALVKKELKTGKSPIDISNEYKLSTTITYRIQKGIPWKQLFSSLKR